MVVVLGFGMGLGIVGISVGVFVGVDTLMNHCTERSLVHSSQQHCHQVRRVDRAQ